MNTSKLLARLAKAERMKSKGHVKNLRKRLSLAGVETSSEAAPTPAPVKPKASKKKTTKKKSE